ncbi:hypothetical protein BH09PAT3_BH09PAT3_1650 [soil metagenome]
MNKRHLRRFWKYFRKVKPGYFFVAAIIFGIICLFALRANSEHMAELRDTVYAADKDGGDVQTALTNLQKYVTAHMNTSLNTGSANVYPPIQLQYTYQRLVQQQGAAQQTANGELYTQAQAYCQSLNSTDFSGRNRVPCIEKYVQEHGSKTSMNTTVVSPSLYQFDFIAPKWSPDLAGWSLLASISLFLLSVITFIADRRIKKLL